MTWSLPDLILQVTNALQEAPSQVALRSQFAPGRPAGTQSGERTVNSTGLVAGQALLLAWWCTAANYIAIHICTQNKSCLVPTDFKSPAETEVCSNIGSLDFEFRVTHNTCGHKRNPTFSHWAGVSHAISRYHSTTAIHELCKTVALHTNVRYVSVHFSLFKLYMFP